MESFWVIYLTTAGFAVTDVWGGSLSSVNFSMREIVRRALSLEAVGVILVHNHPSGDPRPSEQDKRVTQDFADALAPVGVRVIDHLIIANGQMRSFRDMNLLWLASPQTERRQSRSPVPMTSRSDPIFFRCIRCRSQNVSRDGRADWDPELQRWSLREVFDYAHCHDCDHATSLQELGLAA
jgi:hypothetical protein